MIYFVLGAVVVSLAFNAYLYNCVRDLRNLSDAGIQDTDTLAEAMMEHSKAIAALWVEVDMLNSEGQVGTSPKGKPSTPTSSRSRTGSR